MFNKITSFRVKFLTVSLAILIFMSLLTGCTGNQQRGIKSFKSNIVGGLNRSVTLYDYSGKEIRKWEGKIDIADSQIETDFIVDGKKVVIHGGITVIEEK